MQAEKTNQPKFMIRIIEIENIKGIDQKIFELGIYPNKPSLLVAPNGFGKSSIATAFNSMNNRRITLAEDDLHAENVANLPRIAIEYNDVNGTTHNLEATNNSNTISSHFDYFVINNLTKPKGIGSRFGNATARLEIKDVVLVDRIPANTQFGYSYRNNQADFGNCGKVLPNVNSVLTNLVLVEKLSENYLALQRANGNRIQQRLNLIIDSINAQDSTATANVLNDWVSLNCLGDLKQIDYLNTIGDLINEFDIGYNCETKSYLASIQIISLYNNDPNNFKAACTFSNYRLDKQRFDQTLKTFNCTWRNISTSQTAGKLVVKFPQVIHISNGQRDILTFISMLFRAKRHLKKGVNILIIDEVFDYLDDANLTAAQYYITQFIKDFKLADKKIYPLILTHLNPNYFKNFTFSNQKVFYLNKSTIQVAQGLINLLRNRDDLTIKDDLSKYLLHYDPGTINKRNEFRALNIPELWGENDNFKNHLNNEVQNYLTDQPYDPFALCGGLRIRIEEIAYNKLQSPDARIAFLGTHKTRSKLEKAEEMGFTSPESHYLLGIIYNEGMHWKLNQDNVSPIAAKLENLTIKKLIADVFA